eukprot:2429263-Amphidinium_carterae.1
MQAWHTYSIVREANHLRTDRVACTTCRSHKENPTNQKIVGVEEVWILVISSNSHHEEWTITSSSYYLPILLRSAAPIVSCSLPSAPWHQVQAINKLSGAGYTSMPFQVKHAATAGIEDAGGQTVHPLQWQTFTLTKSSLAMLPSQLPLSSVVQLMYASRFAASTCRPVRTRRTALLNSTCG